MKRVTNICSLCTLTSCNLFFSNYSNVLKKKEWKKVSSFFRKMQHPWPVVWQSRMHRTMLFSLDNTFQSQVCTHFPHISQSQVSQGEILYIWTAEHIWYSDFRILTMFFYFRELSFVTLTFHRKNYNLESHPGNLLCINRAENFLFLGSLKLFLFLAVRNHLVVLFLSLSVTRKMQTLEKLFRLLLVAEALYLESETGIGS